MSQALSSADLDQKLSRLFTRLRIPFGQSHPFHHFYSRDKVSVSNASFVHRYYTPQERQALEHPGIKHITNATKTQR